MRRVFTSSRYFPIFRAYLLASQALAIHGTSIIHPSPSEQTTNDPSMTIEIAFCWSQGDLLALGVYPTTYLDPHATDEYTMLYRSCICLGL